MGSCASSDDRESHNASPPRTRATANERWQVAKDTDPTECEWSLDNEQNDHIDSGSNDNHCVTPDHSGSSPMAGRNPLQPSRSTIPPLIPLPRPTVRERPEASVSQDSSAQSELQQPVEQTHDSEVAAPEQDMSLMMLALSTSQLGNSATQSTASLAASFTNKRSASGETESILVSPHRSGNSPVQQSRSSTKRQTGFDDAFGGSTPDSQPLPSSALTPRGRRKSFSQTSANPDPDMAYACDSLGSVLEKSTDVNPMVRFATVLGTSEAH